MLLVIRFTKMPKNGDQSHSINLGPTLKRIFSIPHYREGVVAQFFYVGAQIMCWTFIIQYGTHLFMSQGMEEKAAEVLSQEYNIIAMIIFCLHLTLSQSRKTSGHTCSGRMFLHGRCYFLPKYLGYVLPGSSLRLHVIDVPHNLRYRFDRLRR